MKQFASSNNGHLSGGMFADDIFQRLTVLKPAFIKCFNLHITNFTPIRARPYRIPNLQGLALEFHKHYNKTMKLKKKPVKPLPHAVATQVITLISTSFGLVAALAWNEAIKEYVEVFIKPYFAKSSGVISLFIYAIAITAIAVLVTIQATRILERINSKKV